MSAVPPQSSAVFGSRLSAPRAHGADVAMERSEMTDYVLIHGAWHGSWCWKRMRHLMTAEGHRVFTTLTGLGERVHLLSRDVGLAGL